MNGRNDEREIEDDGFYTVDFDRNSIVTNYIYPPIPIRIYDWQATLRDYEPGDPIGYGATEQEAIDDLRDLLTPDEESCPKCLDTGYRRDWRGSQVQCDDCWNDQTNN